MPLPPKPNFKDLTLQENYKQQNLLAVLNKKMEHRLWLKKLLNQNSDSDHSLMSRKVGSVEILLILHTKKMYYKYH